VPAEQPGFPDAVRPAETRRLASGGGPKLAAGRVRLQHQRFAGRNLDDFTVITGILHVGPSSCPRDDDWPNQSIVLRTEQYISDRGLDVLLRFVPLITSGG
jgi:hypothetical protein